MISYVIGIDYKNTPLQAREAAYRARHKMIEFSQYINPGNEVEFIVDMLAPRQTGTYSAKWALRTSNNIYFCETEITLTVK